MTPLAPTKLTDLASELQDRWQRGVETGVDRVRRELVFEPLEAQGIEPGEDRNHERLTPPGPKSAQRRDSMATYGHGIAPVGVGRVEGSAP